MDRDIDFNTPDNANDPDAGQSEKLALRYNLDHGDEFVRAVREAGCTVVFPAEDELQIDIDDDTGWNTFFRTFPALQRNEFPEASFVVTESASGYPHRHVTVKLPRAVTQWERIALQAALGSDPMRELLSSIRLMRGDPHPTLFVEPDVAHVAIEDDWS